MPINSFLYPGAKVTTGYDVDNSLRFNDGSSDYLYRTGGTATDGKKFTYSAWFKRSEISSGNELFCIYSSNTNRLFLRNNGDTFELNLLGDFGSTTRQFRDPSAWYHFVIACDSTQATASDRGKWYLNGELIFTGTVALDQIWPHGQSTPYFIIGNGRYNDTFYAQYWDGYQSEVCFIDGQQLDPTSFGEFDEDSGIWKPIDVSGLTFGNNGFYLDFENSGSLGADVSGNGNNFTVNNLTAIDQSTDTCTNNAITFNPLDVTADDEPTLSEGNLKAVADGAFHQQRSTFYLTTGKWFWEFKPTTIGDTMQGGVVGSNYAGGSGLRRNYDSNGQKYTDGSSSSYGATYSANDIISVALDLDNGTLIFYKNGVSQGTAYTDMLSAIGQDGWTPDVIIYTSTVEMNFGSPPYSESGGNSDGNGYGNFSMAVPSGYYALNTKNLAKYG